MYQVLVHESIYLNGHKLDVTNLGHKAPITFLCDFIIEDRQAVSIKLHIYPYQSLDPF